jgi:hypothetical protein
MIINYARTKILDEFFLKNSIKLFFFDFLWLLKKYKVTIFDI